MRKYDSRIIIKTLGNLFTIRVSYFFDKKYQTLACITAIACNVFLAVGRVIFFAQKENMIFTPEMINKGLFISILVIVLHVAASLYFNEVSSSVYQDLKKTNDILENNTKEKDAFFATISHEIRNPLQSLLGSVELLQDKQLTSTSNSLFEICKNCCQTVLNIVSNILDMSKISAEKMQISPTASDLREIISRVIRVTKSRADSKNVKIKFQDDDDMPPSIELDTQRVEQVILNLVSNAIKFTTKGQIIIKLQWFTLNKADDPRRIVKEAVSRSSWKQVVDLDEGLPQSSTHLGDCSMSFARPGDSSASGVKPKISSSITISRPHRDKWLVDEGKVGVAKIEIIDTGIGIEKGSMKRLFHPYQQADPTISR